MAGVNDSKNMGYNRANNNYGTAGNMYGNQYGNRGHAGPGYGMPLNSAPDMAAIAHSFQGMNLSNPTFAAQAKNAMATSGGNYGGLSVATAMPGSMYGASGQYVFPNSYGGSTAAQAPGMYTPHVPQYMPMGYQGYAPPDNSPASQHWTPTTATTGEVPTLITPRRDSVSSNENDQPITPSYAYPPCGQVGVAVHRSPSGVFTASSPSPTSLYGVALAKQPDHSDVSPTIKGIVSKEPPIPRAIPAPSSPAKPLDRALENQRGETNVYIRGLLPTTSDEMLDAWGRRFGDIKSSKSIIDLNNGLCKGFGFIKYHNYEDAENCIRGFHYLGYEVSFARESFYSKLKAFSDEANTNLYVSNLPKSWNEHQLSNLFPPYNVCSARILRLPDGQGRGVGFARFETRDVCEEVIKSYNNFTVKTPSGEELQIQLRYADTQQQKEFKQSTHAARQFRSAEYEYATQNWRTSRPLASTDRQNGNEFEQYLGTSPSVPVQSQRWAQYGGLGAGRSPLGALPYTNPMVPPTVQTNVAAGKENVQTGAGAENVDGKSDVASPATVQGGSTTADSAVVSDQE